MDDDVGALEVLRHSLLGIGCQSPQPLQRYTPLHLRLTKDLYLGSLLVEDFNPFLIGLDILLVVLKERLLHLRQLYPIVELLGDGLKDNALSVRV